MQVEIKVPELSESVTSGTLLAWRKAAGEAIVRDEVVADLETDKVVIEIAAPAAGVLAGIRVAAGEEVKPGALIGVIDTDAVAGKKTPEKAEAPVAAPPPVIGKDSVRAAKSGVAPKAVPDFLRPSERRRAAPAAGAERREPMSRLRQRVAERLKEAQNTAALLTTFNEIDMQQVQALRKRYQESFQREHGVRLGLSSFFVKAVCHALKAFPVVNAQIEGRDIVYRDACDIGVAVSSGRGLVVPILRDAQDLGMAEIERRIADFAERADRLQLQIGELEGGTFTISNGGVFGSLLSTPIVNPPQSAVLGLHKIQDRPVAENGQVVIRPMMYVALSYDHRLIDGRDAVGFLVAVKAAIEDPARLLLDL